MNGTNQKENQGFLKIHTHKKLILLLHTIVSSIYIGCSLYSLHFLWLSDNVYVLQKLVRNGATSIKYLFSVWVVVFETIYFCSYSVTDAFEMYYLFYNKSKIALLLGQHVRIIAGYILFALVFPLSVVIVILFWGFYLWDRELIYPKIMDEVSPSFINHMMHTYPVLLSILYMFLEIKNRPPKKEVFVLLTTVMSTYSLVFSYVNYNCDKWLYPALDKLTPPLATLAMIFAVTTPYVFVFVGYYIHSKLKDVRSYLSSRAKIKKKS